MEKLYVLRNGCIVSLKNHWEIKIISNPKKIILKDCIKNKKYIVLAWERPKSNLYILDGGYCLSGGYHGSGFDLIGKYNNIIQEELDV